MNAALPGSGKGNPLWDFAVWAYAEPGVEKACLALQNRVGADVNMILFCCWLAYRGTSASQLAQYVGAALKVSREWQRNLVEPLRICRENLKTILEAMIGESRIAATALRERIKQCELEMEQLQTLALYGIVIDGGKSEMGRAPLEQKDDALNTLTVYFAAIGARLDPLARTHVMRILTAVFGA